MSENSRLRIHAQITPECNTSESAKRCRFHFFRQRFTQKSTQTDAPVQREKNALSSGDRLLRNSALACALLLAVLAMGNINQPWAVRSSEAVRRALTMHIDLDDSIGKLTFVRDLLPESALVFLNVSGKTEFVVPTDGEPVHPYATDQPWLLFSCTPGSNIYCAADGTVTAVSELSGEAVGLLIDHGNGVETVYAYMSESSVQPGDAVSRGQCIGLAGPQLYFELREGENAVDPSEKMGL